MEVETIDSIMPNETFIDMLTGGHPNSLGRTLEVVELTLVHGNRLEELYQCYFCDDEVVRLRTSNAIKRISREKPEWLVPYLNQFIEVVSTIEQASTQWTLADLLATLTPYMSASQMQTAKVVLKQNMVAYDDWIVLKNTMQTLASWAKSDPVLASWLRPQLQRLSMDKRKSVSGCAIKLNNSWDERVRLEQALGQWDGQSSHDIGELYQHYAKQRNFVETLIGLLSNSALHNGITWLLKHHLEQGHHLAAKQIAMIYKCVPSINHWQAKLHILQSLPYMPVGQAQQCVVEVFVRRCLSDPNKFIRAWAYNGMYELSLQYPEYKYETSQFLHMAMQDEAPSVQARIRNIMKKIG